MRVYFEDWSDPIFLARLDKKGLAHKGRIIKAFASARDPRGALGRQGLRTFDVSAAPFGPDETYEYPSRSVYTGAELETTLAEYKLTNGGEHIARALFRFSNQFGFCQAAMLASKDDGWLIDHPFGDIDGWEAARRDPVRERSLHLDVFFADSLSILRGIVDYDDPDQLMARQEGMAWRNGQ